MSTKNKPPQYPLDHPKNDAMRAEFAILNVAQTAVLCYPEIRKRLAEDLMEHHPELFQEIADFKLLTAIEKATSVHAELLKQLEKLQLLQEQRNKPPAVLHVMPKQRNAKAERVSGD